MEAVGNIPPHQAVRVLEIAATVARAVAAVKPRPAGNGREPEQAG